MDSLLSNSQRCVRKADSLVKYGLFDEALGQLDKSIVLLHDLKSVTSCYDSIQMINVQIDSIDRKMRSVAIKRSESIKKKNQIENLIRRRESGQHKLIEQNKHNQQQQQQQIVLIENTNILFKNASKLNKDDKSIIEELSTTNGEFKKVNEFLINEIENLKKENDFLKIELLKIHMNDSLNDLSSSQDNANTSSISNSSSSVLTTNSSSSSNEISTSESLDTFKYNNVTKINTTGLTMTSQKSHTRNLNDNNNRIDLSKYIFNEDDSDVEVEDNIFNDLNSYTSMSLPPNEFIID